MSAQGGIVSSTTGSTERSSGRTILAVILGVIALVFIVVAIIYLAEPAKSLPSFIPGHIAGSSGHHPLKATGAFVVGVVFAVGAWFALAYKPKPQAVAPSEQQSSPAAKS
jgi:multisubunit Na+/H+ antiporter MnhB subunit